MDAALDPKKPSSQPRDRENIGAMGSGDPKSAAEAFAKASWRRIMPELLRYAKGCVRGMGWGQRGAQRSAILEAEELVNVALEAILSGERAWVPSAGADEDSFIAYVCMTMKSVAVNTRTSAAIKKRSRGRRAERSIENAKDERTPERELAAREELDAIERALGDDAEAVELFRAMRDVSPKREEIEAALGWSTQKVKVVRMRMRRKIDALNETAEDAAHEARPESDEEDES
jgi:hypothetical protein